MKRNICYDMLRGIAIILIALGHMGRGLVECSINSNYSIFLDNLIYSIHLPILFILSGIFEKKAKQSSTYKMYLKKNIISLYIPYLIMIFAFWFIKMYIISGNNETSISDLPLLFISGKWVFWFLLSLLLIKIIHGFFEYIYNSKILNILLWLTFFITSLFFSSKILDYLSYGFFYNFGYNLEDKKLLENSKKIFLPLIILIPSIFLGIFFINYINLKLRMVVIGIPMFYILFLIFRKVNKNNFLSLCGKYSMVIYLLHTLFTSMIRIIFLKLGITNFTFLLLFGTIASVLLSLLVVFCYNKFTFLKFVQYIFYPNKLYKKKHNERKYIYTELIGLPGSGKSYYMQYNCQDKININKKYLYSKSRIIRLIKKIFLSFKLLISNLNLFVLSFKVIQKSKILNFNKKMKMFLYLNCTLYLIYKYGNDENNYFEEGLLQVLYGICYCSIDYGNIINVYFKYFNDIISKNVIYINTSYDLIRQRLVKRNEKGNSELEHDIKINNSSLEKSILIINEIYNKCLSLKFNIKEEKYN